MSERVAVLGDIHGHTATLESVIDHYENTVDRVLLVGDLVAGGPDTAGTLDLCKRVGATTLVANNEWDLRGALTHADPKDRYMMQQLYLAGYQHNPKLRALFASYGIYDFRSPMQACRRLGEIMTGAGHLEYLEKAELYYEHPEFIAVHAGLTDQDWRIQKLVLNVAGYQANFHNFLQPPEQITSHELAKNVAASLATSKVVVSGHAHKGCGPVDQRVTADGKRVRLATQHWANEPFLVWESWTGEVRQFPGLPDVPAPALS